MLPVGRGRLGARALPRSFALLRALCPSSRLCALSRAEKPRPCARASLLPFGARAGRGNPLGVIFRVVADYPRIIAPPHHGLILPVRNAAHRAIHRTTRGLVCPDIDGF